MQTFHPIIQKWFVATYGHPTEVQQQSWPLIRQGKHLLITAPTGSGKTLTAFLWSINQLFNDHWEPGRISVLYISPLKALNNDIQRNLVQPLSELDHYLVQAGQTPKQVSVSVRSGDTPQSERRQMLRRPPEILITTPESLNHLLTSKSGRQLFTALKTVILDEIHAVVGTKRGTHLITAVDRLVAYSGEFQRIALSATIRPLKRIAAFVGGFTLTMSAGAARYQPRPVTIVKSRSEKQYDIRVDFPELPGDQADPKRLWPALIQRLKQDIGSATATLFFANSRRLTEKIARLLNENEVELLAYAHHGSLSKELRLAVEQKLKQGELSAIVATSSLELGIDVGALDQVGLVQTPMSISAALQRVGRAGHRVGHVSQGVIYPMYGLDLIHAATMAKAIIAKDVEEFLPIQAPLDVLTQVILSMTCHQERHIDDIFNLIRTSYPYRQLPRKQFDLVVAMLEGRYADLRIRELSPRVSFDRLRGTVTAKRSSDFLLYMAGGTIPDRGYFDLKLDGSHTKIGELDEEFVWERSRGDLFAMGTRVWQVKEITPNEVIVTPAADRWDIIPFWKADGQDRDTYFSEKVSLFLEWAEHHLPNEGFAHELERDYHMQPQAAKALIQFLQLQKRKTKTELPHRHHILVEHVQAPSNQIDTRQVILHTLWGGRLNRPFALALGAAWEKAHQVPLQVFADNDGVVLMLPSDVAPHRLFELVSADTLETLLFEKLAQTGTFGAYFRENAGRALLLPKQSFNRRMPLWLNRLRAKKLLKSIQGFDDFPIMLETFRTCLQDQFDLGNLKHRLEEIQDGVIRWSASLSSSASPFAANLIFRQTNLYMYADDTPLPADGSGLKGTYIQDLIDASRLRPRLADDLLITFGKKVQRSQPGYAPEDGEALLDWLKERLMIPVQEWEELLAVMERPPDHGSLGSQVIILSWSQSGPFVTCLEVLPRFSRAFSIDLQQCTLLPLTPEDQRIATVNADQFKARCLEKLTRRYQFSFETDEPSELARVNFMGQWLSYYGPMSQQAVEKVWGLNHDSMDQVVRQLVETERVVVGHFSQSSQEVELCDRENLERIYLIQRQLLRPSFDALAAEDLALFMAQFQGVGQKGKDIGDLQKSLEKCFGLPLPVRLWEEVVWPSRISPYQISWLDRLLQTTDLIWFGQDGKNLAFAFPQDLELFLPPSEQKEVFPLPSPAGKYSFFDTLKSSQLSSEKLAVRLWEQAWQGKISNDTFEVIRRGIQHQFKPESISDSGRRSQRRSRLGGYGSGINRWQSSRPLQGNWFALPQRPPPDPLEDDQLIRDRVRQLLKRYGILFRQLLTRELPLLKWKAVFKALRLMEFSGEVLCGHFFEGIPGLQFASREAFSRLQQPLARKRIYWLNAADPASLCGIDLPDLKRSLPARHPTTFLVYQGSRLILIARRSGRTLEVKLAPDDPHLPASLHLFRDLLGRDFNPMKKIIIETVNGKNVLKSSYLSALVAFGLEESSDGLELWRSF